MQKIQDDEAREIEQSGLADKDAFAELKALAGEGGTMAHGEGLPTPPQPRDDPAVSLPASKFLDHDASSGVCHTLSCLDCVMSALYHVYAVPCMRYILYTLYHVYAISCICYITYTLYNYTVCHIWQLLASIGAYACVGTGCRGMPIWMLFLSLTENKTYIVLPHA